MNIYATLVRDSMPFLAGSLYQVRERLVNKDDKFLIIENDSTDGITRPFLCNFKETSANEVIIKSETLGAKPFTSTVSLERAEAMSSYRNKVLDHIIENDLNPEYLIMFDSDLWSIPKENFNSMFTKHAAVTSNGLFRGAGRNMQTGQIETYELYYDTWAYQGLKDDTINVSKTHSNPMRIFPSGGLLEVRSGFGGLGVYKWDLVKECRYKPYEFNGNKDALCEHGGFSEEIRKKGHRVFINTMYKPEVRI